MPKRVFLLVALAAALYHGLGNFFADLFHVEGLELVELFAEAAAAAVVVIGTWRWMRRQAPARGSRAERRCR